MALQLDHLTRIVNVQWGGKVIVVFVDLAFNLSAPPPTYERVCKTGPDDITGVVQGNSTLWCGNFLSEAGIAVGGPIDPMAEYLFYYYGAVNPQIREVWKRYAPGGDSLDHVAYATIENKAKFLERWNVSFEPSEYQCSAYEVGTNVGNFIKSTPPTTESETIIRAFLFAMGEGVAASLQRAKSGIEKILSSTDMAPSGLLWTVTMSSDQVTTWKMRHGDHRPPSPPSEEHPLPNAMTQCYPLGSAYSIGAYRLDPEGTGTAYGIENVDPAWAAASGDPPPLINDDRV